MVKFKIKEKQKKKVCVFFRFYVKKVLSKYHKSMSDYVEVENLPKANELINEDYVLINQNEDDAKVDMGTIKDFVRPLNASTTESGLVSTAEQTFSGKKNFSEIASNKATISSLNTSNANITEATVQDLHITGNLVQDGETIETEVETLKVKDQIIVTRSGATTGMTDSEVTGIVAEKYDGQNNGVLVFSSDGIARVGDEGNAQPLATREETPNNGSLQVWDEQTQSLKSFPFGQKGQYLRQGENGLEYGSAVVVDGTASEEYVDNKVQEEATLRQNAIEEAKKLANATGVLAVAKGGTGATTKSEAFFNLTSDLLTGSNISDNECLYYEPENRKQYGKYTFVTLWGYIKGKISSVLGLTATSYGGKASTADTAKACTGNSATATKATQDGSGNNIVNTYATKTALSNQIAAVKNALMPIGYVYTQWPLTKSPTELNFPGTWSDISWKYKGLFPRVAGGDAAPFNKTLSVASQSGTKLTFASGHGIIKGYMLINTANGEQRSVTAVSGNTITLNSAFSTTLTTVYIGQNEGLPNITAGSYQSAAYTPQVWTTGKEITDNDRQNGAIRLLDSQYSSDTSSSGAFRKFSFNAANGETKTDGTLKTATEHKAYGASNHVTPCNATIKVWQRIN